MKPPLLVHGIVLAASLLCQNVRAAVYQSGESFAGFRAVDQHGETFVFKPRAAKFVIFDTPGESGESAPPKDPDWFANNGALLVVNLADLSRLKRKLAKARLESKPFRALILEDKNAAERIPIQEGKLTVLILDDSGKISGIQFVAPGKELLALVAGENSKP